MFSFEEYSSVDKVKPVSDKKCNNKIGGMNF